ncbi:MAG: hypothetical protein K0R69_974 [Clostridia bacterium]|jgi:uncharacterized protein|nr:hypothetical protein [Clostridia bacterium]
MERFNKLIADEVYLSYSEKNTACEKTRIFCRHDSEHFLDTARIGYILALEEGKKFSKEVIYTCAFLHDIGRWQQYTEGIPHEKASHQLAMPLLQKYGFTLQEQKDILEGILGHRKGAEKGLGKLMYKSDKLSRRCYSCRAESQCDWSPKKKNKTLIY